MRKNRRVTTLGAPIRVLHFYTPIFVMLMEAGRLVTVRHLVVENKGGF